MLRLRSGLALSTLLILGCTHYRNVQTPPAVDLSRYPGIALLQFASPQRPQLGSMATQRFLENLTQAQPGIQLVPAGPVESLAPGKPQLDPDTIRQIGAKLQVGALMIGHLEVTSAQPRLDVGALLNAASVSQEVTASLTVTLYDAQSGAVVWSNSDARKASAGGVSFAEGAVGVDTTGEDAAYGNMVRHMAFNLTDAFRSHWVRVEVHD